MTLLFLVSIKSWLGVNERNNKLHTGTVIIRCVISLYISYITFRDKKKWIKNKYKLKSLCRIGKCIRDRGLNTRTVKDEDNKIGVGCDLVEIATVRCKVRHMIGLLCAKIMSPWYNCCFWVSVVLISKFNIL